MPLSPSATRASPSLSWAQQLPCEARVADGAIRGAGIGLLWGVFYGPGEFRAAKSGKAGATALARPAMHALQHGGLTTLGFAAFLAGYNGIYCSSERRFGPSPGNALLAGGCMGSLLCPAQQRLSHAGLAALPFFEGMDWAALAAKQVAPPQAARPAGQCHL